MLAAALMAAGLKNHANLDRPATETDLLRAFGFSALGGHLKSGH
jgi:hypothetical protein